MSKGIRNGIISIIIAIVIVAGSFVYTLLKIKKEDKNAEAQRISIIKEQEDDKVELKIPRRTTRITLHELNTSYWIYLTEEELETFKDHISSVTGRIKKYEGEEKPIYYVQCSQGEKTLSEFYFYSFGAVYEKTDGEVKIVEIEGDNPAFDLMLEWFEQIKSKK